MEKKLYWFNKVRFKCKRNFMISSSRPSINKACGIIVIIINEACGILVNLLNQACGMSLL